jgi:drug/metabolite transporter (DMT)-like permease
VSRAPASAVWAAVFLGVAPSALGFALWARALARMPVGQATAWLYVVPAVAIVVSLVWLSQLPSLVSLGGGALAVGGVVLAARRRRPPAGARERRVVGVDEQVLAGRPVREASP